jgi:type IV secretion system protein VirD4
MLRRPPDVASLRDAYGNFAQGIYIGIGRNGVLFAGPECSVLVNGPPRSGKTSSLVVTNIYLATGPVVSTSTKSDVMRATAAARVQQGSAFLYDPSGEIVRPTGVEPIGWSPLTSAANWDTALQTADSMVRASRIVEGGYSRASGDQHWTERAGALLAPILHAAALESIPMRTVVRWIDRRDGATPLQILDANVGNNAAPTDLLSGIVGTDARELSGIWSTASGVLSAYRSEAAIDSTEFPPLDADEFCRGSHTMYICSAGQRQRLFVPLVVGVIDDVREATYERARSGRPAAPTLLALDEMANIAPLPDIESMVAEGPGQGLLVLACLQDLSQARSRWGPSAEGWFSLFGTTVVLPGIADPSTLRVLSELGGDREVATTTRSHSIGEGGHLLPGSSVSTVRLPRYPVDAISRGRPGTALVLSSGSHLSSVDLTPAHTHRPWRDFLPQARTLQPEITRAQPAPAGEREPPAPAGRGR